MADIQRTVTIKSGQKESEIVPALGGFAPVTLLIMAPIFTEVVMIEVSDSEGSEFVPFQEDDGDVTLQSRRARQIEVFGGCAWRLVSSTPANSDREFRVIGNRIGGP